MKKFFLILTAILLLSGIFAISAFAIDLDYDLNESYYEVKGALTIKYNPGSWIPWDDVYAYTELSLADDQTGYCSVTLYTNGGTSSDTTPTENLFGIWTETEKSGQDFATQVNHYGRRYTPDFPTQYFVYNVF